MKQEKKELQHYARLRHLVLTLALCLFGGAAAFANDYNVLIIQFVDGTTQSYVLDTRPKVTFDAQNLYVHSPQVDDTYEYRRVKKFVFETDDVSAIQCVREGECRLTLLGGRAATVSGLEAGLAAKLCDTAGRQVRTAKADAAGTVSFSLQGLPVGTYILSLSDGKSFRILKH